MEQPVRPRRAGGARDGRRSAASVATSSWRWRRPARRVVAGVRSPGDGEYVVAEARHAGGDAEAVTLDLTDRGSIERAVEETVGRFGRIDILVNNAGLGTNHDALDATGGGVGRPVRRERPRVVLRLPVGRPPHGRATARPHREHGVAGRARRDPAARRLQREQGCRDRAHEGPRAGVGPFGVTVNCVAPTFVRTPGTAERLDRPEFLADVLERIPVGRVGTTTDVAGAVIYLASDAPRSSRAPSSSSTAAGRRASSAGSSARAGMSSPTKIEPFQYASSRCVPRRHPFRSRCSSSGDPSDRSRNGP